MGEERLDQKTYSDLALLDDGQILCSYEAGDEHPYERIELVQMSWAELSSVSK